MDVRLLLLPVLAAGITWFYWPMEPEPSAGAPARTAAAPRVLTAAVQLQPLQQVFEAIGTARAERSITLYPAVEGEVMAVHFRANQFVEAETILLELDRRDATLALALARERVRDAERTLNRYLRPEGSGAFAASTVDEARTALELARLEAQRAAIHLDDHTLRAPFAGHVGLSAIEPGDRIDADDAITTLDDRQLAARFDCRSATVHRAQMRCVQR
jgi:Membrane-fusion protein